jgi:hypothetical protein
MNMLMGLAMTGLGLIGSITLAHDQSGPYGSVSDLWSQGAVLAEQGDFAGAQRLYETAFQESRELSPANLVECAEAGSLARIQAMVAAQEYIFANGENPQTVQTAQAIASQQFETTWDTIGRERPELLGGCP